MSIATDMSGKVALVTGAASGLGRETALALSKAGAKVYLVDVNAEGLAETAGMIEGSASETADLSDAQTCARFRWQLPPIGRLVRFGHVLFKNRER